MESLLVATTLLPLAGALLVLLAGRLGPTLVRLAALAVAVATLVCAGVLAAYAPPGGLSADAAASPDETAAVAAAEPSAEGPPDAAPPEKPDDAPDAAAEIDPHRPEGRVVPVEVFLPETPSRVYGDDAEWPPGSLPSAEVVIAPRTVLRLPGEFAVTDVAWLPDGTRADIRFSLGLDGLSLWLFALTTLLMVTSVLVSWRAIADRPALYYAMLLLLECGCLGVFAARDVILFYVFFEFTLIPLFFLIGIWGSGDRRYAAMKFFLYTFAGSVLTFLGLLAIVVWDFTAHQRPALVFSIAELTAALAAAPMPQWLELTVFLALLAGFAIKVPLFPLHTWLPLAHTEAPTAGSVMLAGVMLKIGTYGLVRFNMAMLPAATEMLAPLLLWLSAAGILYGAFVALAQRDMKRLIAYSSVSHLGFCTLGLFALNRLGNQGAVLQMVNHGISTGALFALVGMLYERYHTREIAHFGGIARRLPLLATLMLLFTLSSIGLPGLNGFAGEFLLLAGMFQRGFDAPPAQLAWQLQTIAVAAVFGVVLGAWYMLWLVERVFFGPLKEPEQESAKAAAASAKPHAAAPPAVRDLSFREVLALAPLAVLAFWIGLWPGFFLERMAPSLDPITARYEVPSADSPSALGHLPTAERPVPAAPAGAVEPAAEARVGGAAPALRPSGGWILAAESSSTIDFPKRLARADD